MLEQNTKQKTHGLTTIAVSYENYQALKELGKTGDTFNDVLSKILKNNYSPKKAEKVEESKA
jgi:predicted CopG family antitoxin